jgi:magnesium-transporting ATPase (P-type)
MSVIVEHPVVDATGRLVFVGQGPVFLYCKGADSAILARTVAPATPAEGQRNALSKQLLSQWGNDGLRTLVFGSRLLDRADFNGWNARYIGGPCLLESRAACALVVDLTVSPFLQPPVRTSKKLRK